ncbi:molybdopterin molybdotransferase MoeA [Streptomyces sp. NPDC054784]
MSGADELDEALALANDRLPAAGSRRRPAVGDDGLLPGWLTADAGGGGGADVSGGAGRGDAPPPVAAVTGSSGDPDDDEELLPDWVHAPGRKGPARTAPDPAAEPAAPTASAEPAAPGDELVPDWLHAPARTAPAPAARTAPAPEAPTPTAAPPDRHGGTDWREARRTAGRAASSGTPVTLPCDEALGHVLAAPVEALTDLPPFDTSAMDGWAVSGPGPWDLAAPDGSAAPAASEAPTAPAAPEAPTPTAAAARGIVAGQDAPAPLSDGHAVRIATGARVPRGATAVLRSERAREAGTRLRLAPDAPRGAAGQGTDIRPRGQECRSGDRLLASGAVVTPAVLGLVAAAGYDRLTVLPRPRVEVLVLGEELLYEGRPRDGRIRDALGPMIGPWLSALGADVVATRRLGDDAEALHGALAGTDADLVVTTGGTAAGPLDHVRPTLRRLDARLLVDGVEVRPGHPMLLADLGARHLVGLPGNPLAAVSGLLTLAGPLIRALAGRPAPAPVRAPLTAAVAGHPRDTRLVPVEYAGDGAGAVPLHFTGPAMLRGIASASHLAVVPPGGAAAGTPVQLLELPW